ncbi:MAG: phenylalanine--tRNA ligase subunit alpha [Rickettsiales bacterium]|jgi:phenylalanyl-tRNA synthetase alpha chain|nr:phenylalanine--tRNA ligase subunit alpha [Rickettsiales bacterium]
MAEQNHITHHISHIASLDDLQKLYSDTFGKNGTMTARLKTMKDLPEVERAALNEEKEKLQSLFRERQSEIENEAIMAALLKDKTDVTRSPTPEQTGKIHPMTQSFKEIRAIFQGMGYSFASGPEIEDDWHLFKALNFPDHHPARDMQDSFFIDGTPNILRTQTTSVQIRELEKNGAPLKIFAAGTTYRREIDATHAPAFHQIDGVVIDRNGNITLSNLVSDLKVFLCRFFETEDIVLRVRPSYFPFTEPSIEIDMQWDKNAGRPSKDSGSWLELVGAGMIHPNVLKNCNVDPEKYQGFAFGFGWDRLPMLKYGLNDIRKFYDGDIRWLKAKGF